MKLVIVGAAFCVLCVSECSAFDPPKSDAGSSTKDASSDTATEATACVPQNVQCTSTSVCCLQGYQCNINSGLCEAPCLPIGSVCNGGDCCSGICNGTCE